MKRAVRATVLVAAVVLAGCAAGGQTPSAPVNPPSSSSPPSSAPPASALPPSGAPSSSPTSSAAESASPTASTTTPTASTGELHPCTLLTADEASQVNGVTYGAGTESPGHAGAAPGLEDTDPPSSQCVWQNTTSQASVTVQVTADASSAAADARLQAFRSSLKSFNVTDLSGFADGGFIARAKNTISTGGIYAVDGSTVFDVTYLQGTAPDDNALQHWAILVMGSLP